MKKNGVNEEVLREQKVQELREWIEQAFENENSRKFCGTKLYKADM